jgi:hypothetical protein
MSSAMDQECTMCVRKGAITCNGCNTTKYCSTECQNLDKPVHDLLCKTFKDFTTPPKETMRRAIYFPDNDEGPRFIWLPTNLNPATDREVTVFKEILEIEPPIMLAREFYSINRNLIQNRQLEKSITIFNPTMMRSNPETNDVEVKEGKGNYDFASLTRGNILAGWRGPVFAYCHEGVHVDGRDNPPEFVENIELADLRHIADWLTSTGPIPSFSRKSGIIRDGTLCANGEICGVRINCGADSKLSNQDYEGITVPIDDPVFRHPASAISNLIGIPIQFRMSPSPSPNLNKPLNEDLTNKTAAALATDITSTYVCEPTPSILEHYGTFVFGAPSYWNKKEISKGVQGFGSPPSEWAGNVGSVIAVRTDGKVLHPEHLHAICFFCGEWMRPEFYKFYKEATQPTGQDLLALREKILDEMTKAKFLEFYQQAIRLRMQADPGQLWAMLPSPYDV